MVKFQPKIRGINNLDKKKLNLFDYLFPVSVGDFALLLGIIDGRPKYGMADEDSRFFQAVSGYGLEVLSGGDHFSERKRDRKMIGSQRNYLSGKDAFNVTRTHDTLHKIAYQIHDLRALTFFGFLTCRNGGIRF